jgi:serine/threonine protein phosphatase PrpC
MTENGTHISAACKSDVGKVRDHNEDACLVDIENNLFIVSDGMGGAHAGELASKVVVEVLPRIIKKRIEKLKSPSPKSVGLSLRNAIIELSRQLHDRSADQIGLRGMGATVVLVLLRDGKAYIANLGDSRAYLFRGNRLKQLTEDHSIVGILLRHGDITPEEAKKHPARGRLSRYVGMEGEVYPDVRTLAVKTGDRLLLCSDGLTNMVPDDEIAFVLAEGSNPQSACETLVKAANTAGGTDNITVIWVDFQ